MSFNLAILQTCDPVVYAPVLDVSSEVAQDYAKRHGYDYFQYRGIWKDLTGGPIDATMNRIWWLQTFIDSKWDYLFYMDADAIIVDKSKRLEDVIGRRASPSIEPGEWLRDHSFAYCAKNIGVFGINLRHRDTIKALQEWEDMADNADYKLDKPKGGSKDDWIFPNDQTMFHKVTCDLDSLKKFQDADEESPLWRKAFNFNGPFIKQMLRGGNPTVEDKLREFKKCL